MSCQPTIICLNFPYQVKTICIMQFIAGQSREQCGPLDIEIISEEFMVMLRQLSYAIKNQLKAPKAPY